MGKSWKGTRQEPGEVNDFDPLRNPRVFAQVRVNHETGTIEWPSGADLAPEFLREKGIEVAQIA